MHQTPTMWGSERIDIRSFTTASRETVSKFKTLPLGQGSVSPIYNSTLNIILRNIF